MGYQCKQCGGVVIYEERERPHCIDHQYQCTRCGRRFPRGGMRTFIIDMESGYQEEK